MKKILSFILLVFGITSGCFAAQTATDIYLLAQTKSTKELNAVENIDTVGSDGNTALCIAIKNNDVDAYNILKKSGANTEPKCIKNIPTDQYKTFLPKVAKSQRKTFLGIGKWGWGAIGTGILVGAGAVALDFDAGDDSSNSDNEEFNYDEWVRQEYPYPMGSCPEGYAEGFCSNLVATDELFCKCDVILYCGPQYKTECQTGYIETGNTCKSGPKTYVECVFDSENYIEQNDTIYPKLNCVHGMQEANSCLCETGWNGDLCNTPATCPYTTTSCAKGYIATGNSCKSGENTYVECVLDSENYIEQNGTIYPKLNCVHGMQEANSCLCETGWIGDLCNTSKTCPYATTSCTNGYIATGNTCQSGENTYVECTPNTCDGYDYTSAAQCPNGYTTGSLCQSGATMKYKCDMPTICPYSTTKCSAGYVATGNTCQSGENTYVECVLDSENYIEQNGTIYPKLNCVHGTQEANSCLCETGWSGDLCNTPATCPYTTTECIGGYIATGNTCKSGETNYVECEQIQCGAHSVWTDSGCSCESGYQNYTSGVGCYPISCGVNATQFGTDCYCNPGYTNWTIGYGCYKTLDCGVNASQISDSCVCNSGYQDWTEGHGCYETRDCGVNATQSGGNCVCKPGYQEWTEGYGCYQILNCGANATQHGDICQCNTGYENWSEGSGCTLIELNCGINAIQNGTHCECLEGFSNWQKGVGCYKYGLFSDKNANLKNQDKILIENNSNGAIYDIYGMKLQSGGSHYAYNAKREGTNQYWNYVNEDQHHCIDSTDDATIRITNEGNNDVYAMHVSGKDTAINAYSLVTSVKNGAADEATFTSMGDIYITNTGDGNIYGIFGEATNASAKAVQDHSVMWAIRAISYGFIHITNTGDGLVYGMYNGSYNAKAERKLNYSQSFPKAGSRTYGYISIRNVGDGDVYGMYGTNINNAYSDGGFAEGHISINNTGTGNVYAMSGSGTVNNASTTDAGGVISIINDGIGNAYGMYTENGNLVSNGYAGKDSANTTITIINKNNGMAYGMYNGSKTGTSTNGSEIEIQNLANGDAIGMFANGGTLTNSGTININNVGTGTVIGLLGNNNTTIENTGTINITRDAYTLSGTEYTPTTDLANNVFGIYAKSGSTVNNSGTINITSNSGMFGIYTESGATITNTGTISLNGVSCDSSTCSGNNNNIPYIVLNGGTLYNSGVMSAQQLNLNSMGGNVVAGAGSQFVIENDLSGDLNVSSDVVQGGNQTTYIAENMIQAGDTSNLNLRSGSAMFDARLADNGNDVVMTMKSFDTLTDNKSLAEFLANNYANGKGTDLFGTLKSMNNMASFNGTLSGITGLNAFTQFAHEDLSAMREISFSMNNKLFENSNRDSFDISDSIGYFSFSNSHNNGAGQYGISSEKIGENWKLGYGMAMANINTGDNNGMNRQNNMWLFYMPATYTNDGYELVVAPKAGFAHSQYNRRGYNNMTYEGHIEKRIFGLMNDLRYPLSVGNWTFAPDMAFNALVYDQTGREDEREFSLVIPDDRTVSIETGLGLYTKYEKTLSEGNRLKLNSGLMIYREFGDTYDIKLGIRGMDGTFNLYNNDYKYRGAANFGIDYMTGRLRLYGNAQYFMDNDNYMNFKGGISYRF